MGKSKIGYEQLDSNERVAYRLFEQAFNQYSDSIDSGTIDRKVDIMKVLQVALGDNPRVIYFNKTQIRLSASLFGGKQIHLSGSYSKSQLRAMNKDLDVAVHKAVEEILLLNPISDYDKLICIYEYLQDHVQYDERELEACCRGNSKNPASHNAYGALVKGLAVCDGISGAFALLAQELGYDCTIVSGQASFRTTGFSSHAWNVIKVGDKFYHVDATWDINHKQQTGEYSYEYFCIDDDTVNSDHDWIISTTPVCKGQDISFYKHNRCFANNLSQLDEIFLRFSKSKMNVVRARISDGISIPEPEDQYLGKRLIDMAATVGRYEGITFVWNRNSRCFFAKFN